MARPRRSERTSSWIQRRPWSPPGSGGCPPAATAGLPVGAPPRGQQLRLDLGPPEPEVPARRDERRAEPAPLRPHPDGARRDGEPARDFDAGQQVLGVRHGAEARPGAPGPWANGTPPPDRTSPEPRITARPAP